MLSILQWIKALYRAGSIVSYTSNEKLARVLFKINGQYEYICICIIAYDIFKTKLVMPFT